MNRERLRHKIVSLIIGAVMIAPWLASVSTNDLKLPHPNLTSQYTSLYQQFLFVDFDGDRLPDEAELTSSGRDKDISVSLNGLRTKSISFDSVRSEPGKLVSGDIDHDDDQDLIWYSQTSPTEIFFCLNNGRGSFGPATRYQPSTQQHGLDLNQLIDRETESQLFGHQPDSRTVCALRADDTPVMETAVCREIVKPIPLNLLRDPPLVPSIYLKHILKRGPPATALEFHSYLNI